ncbi:MAG: hypothetical protein H8E62_06505 [Planctomycetes bacterium]|nr:hypothetical protein [Planctomycetota bacterium]
MLIAQKAKLERFFSSATLLRYNQSSFTIEVISFLASPFLTEQGGLFFMDSKNSIFHHILNQQKLNIIEHSQPLKP